MFAFFQRWLTFHSRPTGDAATSSNTPPRADDLGASLRESHLTHVAGAAAEWNSWESQRKFGEAENLPPGELRQLGEELYFHNPYAHGFINLMALFLTDGLRFEARPPAVAGDNGPDEDAAQAFNHHFQRWSEAERFPELLTEIAVRWLATGECFILHRNADEFWRLPELRLVRSYDVATPLSPAGRPAASVAGAIVDGIESTPGDATQPAAYHVIVDRLRMKSERIPAAAMVHLALNRWQDQARGLPVHLPLLDLLRLQQSYLMTLVRTADARSKMAIVRRVQGGPDEVEAAAQKQRQARAAYLSPGSTAAAQTRELYPRPRVLTVNGGVDYEFKGFNLQADDAQTVNRLLTLPGAAALSLAEYLYSGDASTNTYASATAAERAAFKSLKARARVLARGLLPIVRWVHAACEAQGLIPSGGIEAGQYELGYVLPEFPGQAAAQSAPSSAAGATA